MPNAPHAGSGAAPVEGAPVPVPAEPTPPTFAETGAFVLWSRYEDVAMHFNDLIMKLRTQALAGLAGVVTVSGLAVSFTGKSVTATEWEILFCTSIFLALAWVALFLLDILYYDRLLRGAVEAIVEHEKLTLEADPLERITLSTKIKAAASYHWIVVCLFYGLVFSGLCVGMYVTGQKMSAMGTTPSSSNKLEFKFERGPTEGVDVKIAPTAARGTIPAPTATSETPASRPPSPSPSSTKTK